MGKGKYESLISNTAIFALGTLSSKLMSYFILAFNSRYLTPGETGVISLITTTCNLVLPVLYNCVSESIIRFGLDKNVKKRDVFTSSVINFIVGSLAFLLLLPVIWLIDDSFKPYIHLIYFYVIASCARAIVTNFIRACGYVKLFAIDGLAHTIVTGLLNILFVVALRWGILGALLATVLADGIFAVVLFFFLNLKRFINFAALNKKVRRTMNLYSLPLVPNAISWLIINLSDRYFIKYMFSDTEVGLYDSANRILPQLLIIVSTFFIQAWQLSAFTEYDSKERDKFYSTVFKSYYTFIFLAASAMIIVAKPFMHILDASYFDGWVYIPFLVMSVSFSCLVTFLGTIYNAAKKNAMSTITTFIGAAVNIVLNFLFIPKFGAIGAAFTTFISYFIVFIIRTISTRKYVKISMDLLRFALNIILLVAQCIVSILDLAYSIPIQAAILILILLCNFKYINLLLKRFLGIVLVRLAKKAK